MGRRGRKDTRVKKASGFRRGLRHTGVAAAGFRPLEAAVTALVGVIVLSFAFQMFYAQPEADRILAGLFTPQFAGTDSVLLAAGILGATVMPHVIYLHSALTQRRVVGRTDEEKKQKFRFELVDVVIAMAIAGAINASRHGSGLS